MLRKMPKTFSPCGIQGDQIGRLFTLESRFKITEVVHISGLFFPRYQLCINFDKKCLGYLLGRLFSQTHLDTLAAFQKRVNSSEDACAGMCLGM
jgi:hypothetical protein